jgi:hypothetical protein
MKMTEAFAAYGATLVNQQWACSAIAEDGSVVVSFWQQVFGRIPGGKGLRYEDSYAWDASKTGQTLLRDHLRQARDSSLPVRVVIAIPENDQGKEDVESKSPANKIKKTFDVKKAWVGRVVEFTDERFVIDFLTDSESKA